jgi:hypothetical protein
MKRVLSIMLIAALVVTGTLGMCFAESIDNYVEVSIVAGNTAQPFTGDITFDISTDVIISAEVEKREIQVTPLSITNRTEGADIAVTTVQITGENGWTPLSGEAMESVTAGKFFCLSMEGEDLCAADNAQSETESQDQANGLISGANNSACTIQDGTITEGSTRTFTFDGSIAPQPAPMALSDVATLTVTVAVADGA